VPIDQLNLLFSLSLSLSLTQDRGLLLGLAPALAKRRPVHRDLPAVVTVALQINSTMQFFYLISLLTIGLVAAFMPTGSMMGR
jgi:hypothetical protein